MQWWFLCCLASFWVILIIAEKVGDPTDLGKKYKKHKSCQKKEGKGNLNSRNCMKDVNDILEKGSDNETMDAMEVLESVLMDTDVNETMSMSDNRLVTFLYKPVGQFAGLNIFASDTEVTTSGAMSKKVVRVHLPKELDPRMDNTIMLCMLTWPEKKGVIWGNKGLYESRLIGLGVQGRHISELRERVTISMSITNASESEKPSCVFFNFTTKEFETEGCMTEWKPVQSEVTCSCDHLTYFAVLMVPLNVPPKHMEVMSYITLIGCSLSLVALVTTVVLFITKRRARSDISLKVHINLVIALILLNVHFLPSQKVAQLHSHGLCFYMALFLHYSLLASFSWMALEGFHLYLLFIRVFNIYISRYLLKLSLVGWGVPAVIVIVVVAIDTDTYGPVHIDQTNPNSTEICYISDEKVKLVTTVGSFSLVFLFNITMLGAVVRQVVRLRRSRESERGQAKRDACSLLGITCLLGITWGLAFFSFGNLNLFGSYLFSILNPLQGFFIFLWFCLSLKKINTSVATTTSCET
ncbi:adhesion G-protein coupled receptor G5-like [Genypterus blacodes]|uniref:adhesion G-protein coupled receptor G5-like n=1 Tax=Genypterus blacodes TaxID=154954 RepID=UPI003F75CC9A